MLTLYIIRSNEANANSDKTEESFSGMKYGEELVPIYTVLIDGVSQIKEHKLSRKGQWYIVLYDNEKITIGLKESIPMYMCMLGGQIGAIILVKKTRDGRLFQAPRLFRSHVDLDDASLLPPESMGIKFERALDGWIVEH